jgi:hypothetical protein
MLSVYDDVFDKKWVDELSHLFFHENWKCGNIANRKTWPYGLKGTHNFLGNTFFKRENNDIIHYDSNLNLSLTLVNAFNAIRNKVNKNLNLKEISANLQFKGMDGTLHTDGETNDLVHILMLSNENISEEMGGNFYHEPSDTEIEFRHGRLIEQGGKDLHKGNAFNKKGIARFSVKWVSN